MLRVYCSWPGRIGDDEGAPRRREEAVGDIDGDALLALGLQPVDQQREVDILAGRAVLAAVAGDGGQRVLEDQLAVEQQAADQRRLAVIDRAAGEEAEQFPVLGRAMRRHSEIALALLLLHRGFLVGIDQPALALGGLGGAHLGDDVGQRVDRRRVLVTGLCLF